MELLHFMSHCSCFGRARSDGFKGLVWPTGWIFSTPVGTASDHHTAQGRDGHEGPLCTEWTEWRHGMWTQGGSRRYGGTGAGPKCDWTVHPRPATWPLSSSLEQHVHGAAKLALPSPAMRYRPGVSGSVYSTKLSIWAVAPEDCGQPWSWASLTCCLPPWLSVFSSIAWDQ